MDENNLSEYRKRIDKIDAEIGKLIKERIEIVKDVGKLKVNFDMSVRDENRINEVYKNFAENSGLLFDDAKKIYSLLIEHCINIEKEIKTENKNRKGKNKQNL
ncbi:Prephenate dehydratase (fragment) [groundwater metagenome]|uniref:Prephenate dehydratase n=1 Tax=groundwater metagenome TaxID=717931 RepID=A0A098E6I0_9ZZZZ